MTRKEQLDGITAMTSSLSDEQLADLYDMLRHMTSETSVYETLPDDMKAEIEDAKTELDRNQGIPSSRVFSGIDAKLKTHGA